MILLQMLFHTDHYLVSLYQSLGGWIYGIAFAIVFCETGLVVTPFLPGDSLLFALGSLAAMTADPSVADQQVSVFALSALLILATFCGDNLNYFLGRKFGLRFFKDRNSKILNPKHLEQTQAFYAQHGRKAVILGRFIPIVRTFVPFVAGIGRMPYGQYMGFSILSSVLWTQIFLWAGYKFGELDAVKTNFHWVILGVIVISVLPGVVAWYRGRRHRRALPS